MAINLILDKILITLKEEGVIGNGLTDSIFEIGEQNWYGDIQAINYLEQLINKYASSKEKNKLIHYFSAFRDQNGVGRRLGLRRFWGLLARQPAGSRNVFLLRQKNKFSDSLQNLRSGREPARCPGRPPGATFAKDLGTAQECFLLNLFFA